MAENSLLKEIIIRAKAEGINEASSALDVLQVTVDEVGKTGQLTTTEMNKINKAVYGAGESAGGASQGFKQANTAKVHRRNDAIERKRRAGEGQHLIQRNIAIGLGQQFDTRLIEFGRTGLALAKRQRR